MFFYPNMGIEPKIGKYQVPVSSNLNTAIINYQLITAPNTCSYLYSAGHTKSSRGPDMGLPGQLVCRNTSI